MALIDAVRRVGHFHSFLDLLRDELGWRHLNPSLLQEDMTFAWTADDLRLSESAAERLEGGVVRQLRPRPNQAPASAPWGIFFVEFTDQRVYRTALRQVLRGLVSSRQRASHLPEWQRDHLLFVCATRAYDSIAFAHCRGETHQSARLTTFGWDRGDTALRALCAFNLPALRWPEDDGADAGAWVKTWSRAFDKAPLTKDFCRRFNNALLKVKQDLEKHQGFQSAEAYSRAQLLLQRLVFLSFLQNRGWLDQQRDYLRQHFAEHRAAPDAFSYCESFLETLFWTLASPPGLGDRLQGIPFLNGGLFDDDEFAPTEVRKKRSPPLKVRNATFADVFEDLLEAFNFTVREDTPLDQEVAVDPEMLGEVFESIVLHAEAAGPDALAPHQRKATGSYYTPRIVVHFICREVLRQYLQRHLSGPNWGRRLAVLLELDATRGLGPHDRQRLKDALSPRDSVQLREAIRDLKCCDPAVGSGAFAVGLLHELVNLRRLAETAANGYKDPAGEDGAGWVYRVKEEIVRNCLFGVDIQQQAVAICRLRLWLSLVVDYELGIDPFQAGQAQFRAAITRISQLPNLERNFQRGDSLLDLIANVPVRIEAGALGSRKTALKELQELREKLHHARTDEEKKKLRVEVLGRRLDLTERVLQDQLENRDGALAVVSLAEGPSDRKKRERLGRERAQMRQALDKVQADRTELAGLTGRMLDRDFYPNLRKLEGADCDSPFTFAWQLDFAAIFTRNQPGFDILVGNPPFVTARDANKRQRYRERWERVCTGKYAMLCPFLDLSFGLLRSGGELGVIVSNGFAKRDFGRPLVQDFLPTVDLRKVIDCSGLLFPGHGTPTCLLFGTNRRPDPKSPIRVAGTLPGGGNLRTPPEDSLLWRALAKHHDTAGYADARIIVADRTRGEMAEWPWCFDPLAKATQKRLESSRQEALQTFLGTNIGYGCVTRADEVYFLPLHVLRRVDPGGAHLRPATVGDGIRNWSVNSAEYALYPYDGDFRPAKSGQQQGWIRYLTPFRPRLEKRVAYGETQLGRGRQWFEYSMLFSERLRQSPVVCFPDTATHNHFAAVGPLRVFKDTAPIFTAADPARTDTLVGLLNSSAALFWLKQVCFNKGAGEEEERDRYEFLTGKVEKLPIPPLAAEALRGEPGPLLAQLARLARACRERGEQLPALAMRKVLEMPGEAYQAWHAALPGYVAAAAVVGAPFTTADELREALKRAIDLRERVRAEMAARQEEMDWLVYAVYGLMADPGPILPDGNLALAPEQRPFRLWAQAQGDLTEALRLVPARWSSVRRALWQTRLETIRDNDHVRRLEQPVYKRRWDEQWKIGHSWQCGQPAYDAEFLDAFGWWLSEKAEWWLERHRNGAPIRLQEWSAALATDARVRAAWPVAAEALHRLALWKRRQEERPRGRPAVLAGPAAFNKYVGDLLKGQAAPEDIPFGKPWDEVEKTQRVSKAVKALRGRLNVPRERFHVTPGGLYRTVQFSWPPTRGGAPAAPAIE